MACPDDSTPPTNFERLVAGLEYPMFVVTVAPGGERAGCLVGFTTQCSIDPARYAVFLSNKNHTTEVAVRAETMVVHVLRPGDDPLAHLFGEETGDDLDKFDHCSWTPGPGGAPVLDGCDWFAGRVLERSEVGDHVLHLIEVLDEGRADHVDAGQYGFRAASTLDPGHAP